jgi:hypothetical protein
MTDSPLTRVLSLSVAVWVPSPSTLAFRQQRWFSVKATRINLPRQNLDGCTIAAVLLRHGEELLRRPSSLLDVAAWIAALTRSPCVVVSILRVLLECHPAQETAYTLAWAKNAWWLPPLGTENRFSMLFTMASTVALR